MTLLTSIQGAARVIPVPIPTIMVGSTDPTASLLLGVAQETGEDLSSKQTEHADA